MKWFKHETRANRDSRLQKVLTTYGLEGYGLYWLCLEFIHDEINDDKFTFELPYDAETIARFSNCTPTKVEDMVKKFVELGLFEVDENGRVYCPEYAQKLSQSMVSNPEMRKLIKRIKSHFPAKNRSDLIENRSDIIENRSDIIENRSKSIRIDTNHDRIDAGSKNHDMHQISAKTQENGLLFDQSIPILKNNTKNHDDTCYRNRSRIRERDLKTLSCDSCDFVSKCNLWRFPDFWKAYDKKVNKPKCFKRWTKLSAEEIEIIFQHVPKYVVSTPDKKFRMNPLTYLNGECWNDEIISSEKPTDDLSWMDEDDELR